MIIASKSTVEFGINVIKVNENMLVPIFDYLFFIYLKIRNEL